MASGQADLALPFFLSFSVCLPPKQALRKAAKLAKSGTTAVHAYRLLAQMKQVGAGALESGAEGL